MADARPLIVVEDDPFTRIIELVLDPAAAPARMAAFGRFFEHDLPDFPRWVDGVRKRLRSLHPARVILVSSETGLAAALPEAHAVVVEGFRLGKEEIAQAPRLRAVQKFGTITSNIDTAACKARGIRVLTLRRRANIACAEHALGLMLAAARGICATNGLISVGRLEQAGYSPTTYDRAHTANSNWARITGLRTLYGAELGIVGLGEIGRELALRAAACGMRIAYTQRHRLDAAEEARHSARYLSLDELISGSDFVSLNLPGNATTRGIIGRRELARLKDGALLVNVSRADLVDRAALTEALEAGRLGGYVTDLSFEEPARDDDPLLRFRNVIVTPHIAAQPRFNALDDFEELLLKLDGALK